MLVDFHEKKLLCAWIFTKKCILLLSTIFKFILTVCLKEVAEEAPDDPSDEDFVGVEVVTEGLCKDLIKSSNRSSASSGKKRKFFMSQIQYSLL